MHSRLKALPVDWNYTIPFGLLHAPGAAVIVKRFLSAARGVFSHCSRFTGCNRKVYAHSF